MKILFTEMRGRQRLLTQETGEANDPSPAAVRGSRDLVKLDQDLAPILGLASTCAVGQVQSSSCDTGFPVQSCRTDVCTGRPNRAGIIQNQVGATFTF